MTNQQSTGADLEKAREAIQRLRPDRLCLGGLLDLRGAAPDVVREVVSAIADALLGGGLVRVASAAVEALASRSLGQLLMKWGIVRNETVECLRDIVNAAREASRYIDDEGLRDVVEEVAKKWGWDVDTFRHFVKTAAGKSVTEDEVRRMIEEALEDIEEELENIKRNIEEELRKVESKIEGSKIGIGIFFLNDVENGLLYGNFIVEGGVPRIITWVGTAKDNLVTDLVDVGEFRKVAEDVFSKLVKDGRVVLTGPRGIGKSTLATYVAWRSLLGGLGNMVLNEPVDAVIRVDSLNPGDAAKLNNLIKATSRRFVVIYDPSPIEAYYKPEAMQVVKHGIESIKKTTLKELVESVKNTLRELMEVRNAWVVIILPRELYDEVSKSEELRSILDEIRSYIIDVDLRNGEFLREVIRKYSGCGDVSEGLVKGVMGFDSYTLVAKYVGIWLRESECKVEDVDMALRESAGEPKLFFAHYIWGIILGKSKDLAKKVSVPLILHATLGPIPEGFTYITKAVKERGFWRLVSINRLAKSELEDLREDDLEPIAKWLSTLHEDLIEETLKDLVGLRGEEARNNYRNHGFEDFIKALDWGYEKTLEEVRGLSHEVEPEKVESNLLIFVGERLKNALKSYTNCWKRTALIIGAALAGYSIVPRPEDLPKDLLEDAKYLSDALGECGIDDYLLVGNKIPPLIKGLAYTHVLTEAFVDKYDKAIEEVNTILKIAKDRIAKNAGDRGGIYAAETLYGLGLASIIAKAVESGKPVGPSDADAALHIASFTIQRVASPIFIVPVLSALGPLRGKAPHRYLEPLAYASNMENLDPDTVRYVFNGLNEVLDNYGDVIKGHARFLVNAIIAYANLLVKHLGHFNREEVGDMVDRVADLLNELGKFKSSLGVIALAYTLGPVLMHGIVREHEIDKVSEVLGRLSKMRDEVQELMRDEEFRSYIESKFVKADEKTVKEEILEAASHLKHALAHYRLNNDELDEAARLFNEAAEEDREIGVYENYLTARGWALRAEAIKDSLVDDELVNGFKQLYEEAFNEEHFKPTALYLSTASGTLGEHLVSLALTGGDEEVKKIKELLEEHLWVLNANEQISVLTRLTLNALLGSKDRKDQLGSELKDKLSVNPEELINAFVSDMHSGFLPALMVALGIVKHEDGIKLCEKFNDEDCVDFVLAVKGNSTAVKLLRELLINVFQRVLNVSLNLFKELGVNVDTVFNEFKGLVSGLDGKSLVQLIAPIDLRARLALMLHALINGDGRLAKAHALYGAANVGGKLLTRLLLEAYGACCDLNNDGFRRAIARLFFYHV